MNVPAPNEIKEMRKKIGLTQSDVAERAGLSQSMVARIESGSVDPRVSTLKKIIDVINSAQRSLVTAKDLMHAPVISVSPSDTIVKTVAMMEENGISQLPVLQKGVPIGCISESAIIGAMEEGKISRSMKNTVFDIMEEGFPTVSPSVDIETVVHTLHYHHAVLVMEKGQVIGVITKHDLITLLS